MRFDSKHRAPFTVVARPWLRNVRRRNSFGRHLKTGRRARLFSWSLRSQKQSGRPFLRPALGWPSPFGHATFEVPEIAMHLLKGKTEGEEAFRRVAGKTSRQTIATERGDPGGIGGKCRFRGVKRRRSCHSPAARRRWHASNRPRQRRHAAAAIQAAPRKVSGSGLSAALPIITRSWRNRSSVRSSGPVSGPAMRRVDRSCSASVPIAWSCSRACRMPS